MSVSLEYSHLPPSGRMAGLAVPQSGAGAPAPASISIDLLRRGIMMRRVSCAKTHSSR